MSHSTCPPRSKEALLHGENNYYLSSPDAQNKHEPKNCFRMISAIVLRSIKCNILCDACFCPLLCIK